jgi:hypothetical protein
MRSKSLLLLVGAVAALAVACQDAVGPTRSANPLAASSAASFSKGGSNSNRTELGTLALSPNGGTYRVGDFDIVVPAGAVCDPATTSYGVKHWDEDCTPASQTVTVNVVAKRHGQDVSVDFQPDLRFRPSAGWVIIRTNAYSSLLTSSSVRQLSAIASFFQNFAILYAPSGGRANIDEVRSTGDASLVTHVDLQTGLVWRRVKHFSGFIISAGFSCPSVAEDGTCNVNPTPLLSPITDATLFSPVVLDSLSLSPSVIVTP